MLKQPTESQTAFADQAVLLTEPDLGQVDPDIAQARLKRKKLVKKILLFMGGVLILLALIIILVIAFWPDQSAQPTTVEPTPTPAPKQLNSTLLDQAKQLKQDFQVHDPTNDEFLFPNVSQSIYLDRPKKN